MRIENKMLNCYENNVKNNPEHKDPKNRLHFNKEKKKKKKLSSTRRVKWHAKEWQMVLYLRLVLACWFTCVVLLDRRRFLIARELPNPASVCQQQGAQNT